jgi:signal transduction histidine kinase
MKIKETITIQFAVTFAFLLLIFCFTIFYLSTNFFKEEFDRRLHDRTINTARKYIETTIKGYEFRIELPRKNVPALQEERIRIYDINGNLKFTEDTLPINFYDEFIDKFKNGNYQDIDFVRDEKRQYKIYLYTEANDSIIVIISAVDKYGKTKLLYLKKILTVCFFCTLIITAFLGRIFAKSALKPISDIVFQIKKINASNLYNRLAKKKKGEDEITILADTFNEMLDNLDNAFKLQRMFISNASHELRTPITIISGEIEFILMKERQGSEYKRTLLYLNERMKEFTFLLNGLIELAQTNYDISRIKFTEIRIYDIIWESITEVIKRNPARKIVTNFEDISYLEYDSMIMGNKSLLSLLFINLLENACKFSNEDQLVTVNIIPDPQNLVIKIIDRGIGINKNDLERIFEPFFRSSEVRNRNGFGIGLSLVDQITRIHKTEIKVESLVGSGTTITLLFPRLRNVSY